MEVVEREETFCFYKIWRPERGSSKRSPTFQAVYEIIINGLISSLRFIWISTLRVYGQYKYFTLSARKPTLESDVYRGQILTAYVDPRDERVDIIMIL